MATSCTWGPRRARRLATSGRSRMACHRRHQRIRAGRSRTTLSREEMQQEVEWKEIESVTDMI